MNPREPHSYEELVVWLTGVSEMSGCPHLFPQRLTQHCDSAGGAYIWLVGYEQPYAEAIEQAADRVWLHEGEALRDLPPEAGSLLRLRIDAARELIEEFAATEETPFPYPDGAFQEAVHWLLVDWWNARGIHWGAEKLYVRARVDPEFFG